MWTVKDLCRSDKTNSPCQSDKAARDPTSRRFMSSNVSTMFIQIPSITLRIHDYAIYRDL